MPRPRIGWTWQPIDRSVLGAYWASKCQLAVNTPASTWGNNGFIVRGAPPAPPGRGGRALAPRPPASLDPLLVKFCYEKAQMEFGA
jgi:hypothetical protein